MPPKKDEEEGEPKPKKGEELDDLPTEGDNLTPSKAEGELEESKKITFPDSFVMANETELASSLWHLSAESTQNEFARLFPNGFTGDVYQSDPRIDFLLDRLDSKLQGVWNKLLETETKSKTEPESNFPSQLFSNFRDPSVASVDATVDEENKTVHLSEAMSENLLRFKNLPDQSWLKESDQNALSNLNQASFLGLTPDKIAERKTWGKNISTPSLVASHKPIQPVDMNRFANGKYCSANLPLSKLLTKDVSLG